MGFGGILGLLAVPAVFALVGLRTRHWRYALAAVPLSAGVLVAIATSQARVAVIGAALGLLTFLLLAAFAWRSMTAVVSVLAVAAIAFVVAIQLFEDVDEGLFERYKQINISPSGLVTETIAYREDTFELLPKYMADFPFGCRPGSEGPASTQPGGGPNTRRLAGETQPSFLLLELGIPGLLVFLGFVAVLMGRSLAAIPRFEDPELRTSALGAGGWHDRASRLRHGRRDHDCLLLEPRSSGSRLGRSAIGSDRPRGGHPQTTAQPELAEASQDSELSAPVGNGDRAASIAPVR